LVPFMIFSVPTVPWQGERGAQILVVPELVEFFQSSLVQVRKLPQLCDLRNYSLLEHTSLYEF
jgi:RNA-binding protein YlmH